MSFVKYVLRLFFALALMGGVLYLSYYFTDIKVREELKKECSGKTCPCFNNIVDYRLTKNQAKSFLLYLQNRKVRPETKIMEFTNFDEAKNIMEMFNVCQLEQIKIQQEKIAQEIQESEEINSEEGEE